MAANPPPTTNWSGPPSRSATREHRAACRCRQVAVATAYCSLWLPAPTSSCCARGCTLGMNAFGRRQHPNKRAAGGARFPVLSMCTAGARKSAGLFELPGARRSDQPNGRPASVPEEEEPFTFSFCQSQLRKDRPSRRTNIVRDRLSPTGIRANQEEAPARERARRNAPPVAPRPDPIPSRRTIGGAPGSRSSIPMIKRRRECLLPVPITS